ncbi:MAG: hypothetical protein JNM31_00215 [Flavobacteriales bacterium]|nr:hypothetical protein [Flavobacteriales bacterium]
MRFDKAWVGLLAGLIAPLIGILLYALIYVTAIRPHHDLAWFINELFLGAPLYRTSIVSLGLVADAFLFFAFDRARMLQAMRGVIAAMFVYALYIVPSILVDRLKDLGWL